MVVVAVAAAAYTAFPADPHGASSHAHRHADGSVHTHSTVEAEQAAWSAPERDATVRHGGVHAHGGRVHVHAEAAHSHRTAPEAGTSTVALDGVPPPVDAAAVRSPRRTAYAYAPRTRWVSASDTVETPPPIGRG